MRGRLTSADFWGWRPFRMVRRTSVSRRQCQCPIASASAGAGEPVTCLAACKASCKCVTAARHADTCCCTRLTQLQEGEPERDVLRGLLAHETRMAHLHLPWSGLPRDDLSTVYQQLGSLPAIRHLCGMDLPEPKPRDCCTLHRCNSSRCWSSRCGCAFHVCCGFQTRCGAAACTISMAKQGRSVYKGRGTPLRTKSTDAGVT